MTNIEKELARQLNVEMLTTLCFNKKYGLYFDSLEKKNKMYIGYIGLNAKGEYLKLHEYPSLEFIACTQDGNSKPFSEQLKNRLWRSVDTLIDGTDYGHRFISTQQPQYPMVQEKQEQQEKKVGQTEMTNEIKELQQSILEMQKSMLEGFKVVTEKNPYEKAIVDAIIDKGKSISVDELKEDILKMVNEFIGSEYGNLPTTIEIKKGSERKEVKGSFHKDFEKILKVVDANVPVMLVGRAGSGKNHTLEQVAEALDLDFYFSNAVTQEYTLKGFIDANGHFHETQFYKAFSQGGMFFLDEMDASIPEALIVLNSAIANGYFDFPIGRVRKHERFRVVSASNTWGTGANAVYIGRNQLDGATLDRFVQIEFDYDTELERGFTSDTDLFEFTIDLRKAIDKTQTRAIVSMRALLNADKLNGVLAIDEIIKSVYIKGMNKTDLDIIIDEMKTGDNNKYTAELKKIVKNMKD